MAVGLKETQHLLPVSGLTLAACSAGIYKKERPDLALIACAEGSNTAAVFTQNAFCAAPVTIAKEHLAESTPRFLLINAGNANAGLGHEGYAAAMETCLCLSRLSGCRPGAVLPFSTGVIGEPLPVTRICNALPGLYNKLSETAWPEVNRAIMTTDTVTKGISRQIKVGETTITITGIAKGSGMIRPDMATMLAFIGTDANIHQDLTRAILTRAIDRSFNRISVDGDTSTNDACVLIATGKSIAPQIDKLDSPPAVEFIRALTEVCIYLAQSIVRDGEGATKFVTLDLHGGKNSKECRKVAAAIAHSPLIKTALFASDPNWGRILAAVGRSGIKDLDINKINIHVGDVCIVAGGKRSPEYTESRGRAVFNEEEITIRIELGRGDESLQFWTCDFSYDYVKINAEYRS